MCRRRLSAKDVLQHSIGFVFQEPKKCSWTYWPRNAVKISTYLHYVPKQSIFCHFKVQIKSAILRSIIWSLLYYLKCWTPFTIQFCLPTSYLKGYARAFLQLCEMKLLHYLCNVQMEIIFCCFTRFFINCFGCRFGLGWIVFDFVQSEWAQDSSKNHLTRPYCFNFKAHPDVI